MTTPKTKKKPSKAATSKKSAVGKRPKAPAAPRSRSARGGDATLASATPAVAEALGDNHPNAWLSNSHEVGVDYWCQHGRPEKNPGTNEDLARLFKALFSQTDAAAPLKLLKNFQFLLHQPTFSPANAACAVGPVRDPDTHAPIPPATLWVDYLNEYLSRHVGQGFRLSFQQYVLFHHLLVTQADLMLISPYVTDHPKTLPTRPAAGGGCELPAFW